MKRIMGIAASVAMAAGLLSGASVVSAADTEDVTLWYYWENEGHQQAMNEMIEAYNQSQDQYKMKANYVPFTDFKKQLSIGASANELPDLVLLDSPDHASYASMGIFADLTGKFDVDSYYEGPVASATYEDTLYGVPFGCNCLSLYYNVDMLKDAGIEPPTTWDELKEAAQALTTESVT